MSTRLCSHYIPGMFADLSPNLSLHHQNELNQEWLCFLPQICSSYAETFLPPAYAPISCFQNGTGLTSYDHHLGTASSQQPHSEMEEAPLLLERVLITSGTV